MVVGRGSWVQFVGPGSGCGVSKIIIISVIFNRELMII